MPLSCPPPPPLPPRSSRCVWQVVSSGCPVFLPAGTPFHAVCALRRLRPVALQVRTACPLRLCALALPRLSPPPLSVWRAHHALFQGRVSVGPFQAVCAPPPFLPRSRAPSRWLGGGGPVPPSPCLALSRAPPRERARASGAVWPLGGVGGGGAFLLPPFSGAWLSPGRSGGLRGRGAGSRSASVRPSASLVRAPRRASLASLSSWRVWWAYCCGSCQCAPVRSRSEGGAVGRPCAPAGSWGAGWQADWRRGLLRSLWERVGDNSGARGAWTQWRSDPGAAAHVGGPGPPLAWGGGSPGLGRGVQGRRPPAGHQHSAGFGGGGSRRGSAVPLPPFGPPVRSPGGCGGWLKGPGPGPPTVGFPCASGGGSTSPGQRSTGAPAYVGGQCLVATLSLAPCDM